MANPCPSTQRPDLKAWGGQLRGTRFTWDKHHKLGILQPTMLVLSCKPHSNSQLTQYLYMFLTHFARIWKTFVPKDFCCEKGIRGATRVELECPSCCLCNKPNKILKTLTWNRWPHIYTATWSLQEKLSELRSEFATLCELKHQSQKPSPVSVRTSFLLESPHKNRKRAWLQHIAIR